jgi:hypothetical protein
MITIRNDEVRTGRYGDDARTQEILWRMEFSTLKVRYHL